MRILIVRCGALGDLVYATSVIDALKNEYGDETLIDFVSTPGSAKIFDKDPRVHRVFLLKHKKVPIPLSKQKRDIIKASKQHPYDILINLEFGKQFFPLIQKIQAKKRYGALIEPITLPKNVVHAADVVRYLFKNSISQKVWEQSFPRLIGSDISYIKHHYKLPEKFIIISASNSHQKRNIINYRAWPNEHWKTLIEQLSQTDISIVMIGNKGEEDFFEHLHPYPKGVVDLVGKTPLSDLVTIISLARALIATDTGTAHIAAAVNTEVFTLIGPTPPQQTAPYKTPNNSVHIISANLPCAPCYKTEVMEHCKSNICMQQITPQMVLQSVLSAKVL